MSNLIGTINKAKILSGEISNFVKSYIKPEYGIPKSDLSEDVQISLSKADTALQAVPNTYRTASAQDEIDLTKADKAKLKINVLDYGVMGDGTTDDSTALQAVIDNLSSENTAIYLPYRKYKLSSGIVLSTNNITFICDGKLIYSGSGSAVKSEGHGQIVKIREISASNGVGLEVVAETKHTYNNFYDVHKITAKTYGVYVNTPTTWELEREQSIYHCSFNIGELSAESKLIYFNNTNASNSSQINENHLWVRRGGNANIGVHIYKCGALKFHELVLEVIGTHTNQSTAGIYLDGASECEFRNIRWRDDENKYDNIPTKAIVLKGNCSNNIFYHGYNLDNLDFSELSSQADGNFIYQNPLYSGKRTALCALINYQCGITYIPMHPNSFYTFSDTDFPNLTIGNRAGFVSIPDGIKLNDSFLNGKTLIIGDVFSHFGRSLFAGRPLVLQFVHNGYTPAYVNDVSGTTILDNTDGKYNNKKVVVKCVSRYSSGGYYHDWEVNVIGEDSETLKKWVEDKEYLTLATLPVYDGGVS